MATTKTTTVATPKPKKKRKVYFGKEVQNAIIEFNDTDPALTVHRAKLFNSLIYPAFSKLTENIINTWKFHRYETTYIDLKMETVSELYNKITGYNPDKGRAYSYFTIIARNYLIKKSMTLYEAEKKHADLTSVDTERNIDSEISVTDYQESLKDFIELWCEWCDQNLMKLFRSQRDQKIGDSIIELFKTSSDIDIYNKKLLYVLIRERAGVETQHITKVVKVFKQLFAEMFKSYQENGFISPPKYL